MVKKDKVDTQLSEPIDAVRGETVFVHLCPWWWRVLGAIGIKCRHPLHRVKVAIKYPRGRATAATIGTAEDHKHRYRMTGAVKLSVPPKTVFRCECGATRSVTVRRATGSLRAPWTDEGLDELERPYDNRV